MRFVALLIVIASAFVLMPNRSTAQETDWQGQEIVGPADKVALLGTKPTITGDQTFRMVFRLSSMINEPIPYAVLYANNVLTGWEAVTAKLRKCSVSSKGISNVPLFRGISSKAAGLERYDGEQASMGPKRPVYLIVDFKCEGPIFSGDDVTVQTEFHFKIDLEWQKVNYLFEKRVFE